MRRGAWLFLAMAWGGIACEQTADLGRNRAPGDDQPDATTEADASSGGTGTSSSGGSSSSSSSSGGAGVPCNQVCSRITNCGLLDYSDYPRCVQICGGSSAEEKDCIMQASCASMADQCELPLPADPNEPDDFEIEVCQNSCDTLNFNDCITPSAHAACIPRCMSASKASRDAFVSCVDTSMPMCDQAADCWTAFAE